MAKSSFHASHNLVYVANIERETSDNRYFRRVLYTSTRLQLVVMSLKPGEEIGNEMHPDVDQFFRIEKGSATFYFGNSTSSYTRIPAGGIVVVPAGTYHNVVNRSTFPCKLYTIYTPPNHKDHVIHETKANAENDKSDIPAI